MKYAKFLIATLLLLVCLTEIGWWITVTNKNASFEAAKTEFLSIFPPFLQHAGLLTLIMIVFLVTSAIFFMQSRRERGLKFVATSGMILSSVLAFWQLFSLM